MVRIVPGFFRLPAVLLLLAASPVSAVPDHLEHVHAAGRDYLRLDDWARARGFQIHWQDSARTAQVNNQSNRLTFSADPRQDCRRVDVNGVTVCMSFPILTQNNHAYLSQLDASETLDPILSPPANSPGDKIKTICLDPGHGGKDPGYVVGKLQEKKLTLLLAREVRDQLTKAGFSVFLTRDSDTYVELSDRPDTARRRKADLFVSLHFNAVEESVSDVKGVQVFSCTPAGAASSNANGEGDTRPVAGNRFNNRNTLLAYEMQRAFLKNLPIEDRGMKRARYLVLREATLPAILIEGGFLSHPSEGKKIADPAYRQQMARAIVIGIMAYKHAVRG